MEEPEGVAELVAEDSLRWIFVGGKGGVGKTTTSSSLAIQVAERNHHVGAKTLILSTDPAHSLSDALSQQLGPEPVPVNGVPGLFALEVSPKPKLNEALEDNEMGNELTNQILKLFNTASIPGMDEIMSFMEVMRIAGDNTYRTVIFDTAPTGHTLRFLELPRVAQGLRGVVETMKNTFGGIMSMMGMGNSEEMFEMMDKMFEECDDIERQFADPDLTEFVCVCIPEFLSLYETERLVQHLARLDMDCGNIICNQVLDITPECPCSFCVARHKMQLKYIRQMQSLYEDFTLVFMEQKDREMRGIDDLRNFGRELVAGRRFAWM